MSLLAVAVQTSDFTGADSATSDRYIVERMSRGDGDALASLYDRHARMVYALALRMLGDPSDAEDVAQEVFVQAWRSASSYDAGRGAVAAWLVVMARSRALDRLRRRRGTTDSSGPETLDRLPAAALPQDVRVDLADTATRIRAALRGLPFLQRTAIELAFFDGLSHAEVAERLEQPLGTVKTRIRLGLSKLREALAGTAG
jgi:RNA polymerase sigma-70 factor (ECF subfamily)